MTPEEYCKRYRKKMRDVRRAIDSGRMRGAKTENGKVDIPEDAKIEYFIPLKKSRITFSQVQSYILKAHNGFYYIDEATVGLSCRDYESVIESLIEGGLIERVSEADGVTTTGLKLTEAGRQAAEMKTHELGDYLVRTTISSAAEGFLRYASNPS